MLMVVNCTVCVCVYQHMHAYGGKSCKSVRLGNAPAAVVSLSRVSYDGTYSTYQQYSNLYNNGDDHDIHVYNAQTADRFQSCQLSFAVCTEDCSKPVLCSALRPRNCVGLSHSMIMIGPGISFVSGLQRICLAQCIAC